MACDSQNTDILLKHMSSKV